jgi:bifunctional polynucleotide phosphatase/kinase
MWWSFRDNYIEDDIDPGSITYVGDAAGRKTDFSDADIKFAKNCGFNFTLPEIFFGIQPDEIIPAIKYYDFDEFLETHPVGPAPVLSDEKEMIIMVGPPACGKSTFARKYFPNYGHVNQDTVNKGKKGTKQQCLRLTKSLLVKQSVVIDNTNATPELRAEYIAAAAFANAKVRCIYFNIPRWIVSHLNLWRAMNDGAFIPNVAYYVFYTKLVVPTPAEGCEVITIDWIDITNQTLKDLVI